MKLRPRGRFLAIGVSSAVTFLLVGATPAAARQTQAKSAAVHSRAVDIVGGNFLQINQSITTTYRFKPGTLHVKHGDKLILSNHTNDVHTLTLVSASLLPKTINDVFNCGGPGTICGELLTAHFPNGFPQSQGPPPACTPTSGNTPCFVQYIDNGVGSATTPPGLDTINTLSGNADGDSVLIAPGAGAPIALTVLAAPGSVLPFMCVFHAWMQGKIVVDKTED